MAEQQLNGADIGAGFQKMNRECVPQGMRSDRLADAGEPASLLAGQFDRAVLMGLVGEVAWKEPEPWGLLTRHQYAQDLQQCGR